MAEFFLAQNMSLRGTVHITVFGQRVDKAVTQCYFTDRNLCTYQLFVAKMYFMYELI